jgi:hypothetical protein
MATLTTAERATLLRDVNAWITRWQGVDLQNADCAAAFAGAYAYATAVRALLNDATETPDGWEAPGLEAQLEGFQDLSDDLEPCAPRSRIPAGGWLVIAGSVLAVVGLVWASGRRP